VNVKVEEPGKNNVHNNAFYAEEKLLKSELEAMRDCDPLSARHWIVSFFIPSFYPQKKERKIIRGYLFFLYDLSYITLHCRNCNRDNLYNFKSGSCSMLHLFCKLWKMLPNFCAAYIIYIL